MLSTSTITQQTNTNNQTDIDKKIDAVRKYFQYLMKRLPVYENVYIQRVVVKQTYPELDELATYNESGRIRLFEDLRQGDVPFSVDLDIIINGATTQLKVLTSSFQKDNDALSANNLQLSEKIVPLASSLRKLKSMSLLVGRINSILDFIPKQFFYKYESHLNIFIEAQAQTEAAYVLLKANKEIFDKSYNAKIGVAPVMTVARQMSVPATAPESSISRYCDGYPHV